jgi:hypothetical protein
MAAVTRFCFIGFVTAFLIQLPTVLAFHVPGHIPPTGTCRDPECAEPQKEDEKKDENKDRSKDKKKKCDKSLMEEYERKKKVGLELWQHRGDLNLAAHEEVGEFLGMEAQRYGGDLATDIGVDKGWEYGSGLAKKYMKGQRNALVAKLAQYSGAGTIAVSIGGYLTFVDGAYRAYDISRRFGAYQEEARRAAEEAERLLREALEAFEAALKQAPECLEESRKAAADEKLLDKAKEQIEEWDNNGYLYFDPIRNEAVVYEQALKRAKERLQGGSQGALGMGILPVHFLAAAETQDVRVTKEQLEAAIRDLDEAIQSFDRLTPQVTKYLKWQIKVHDALDKLKGGLSR